MGRLRDELKPLTERYDVVVANPPYMGSKNMNSWLSGWVKRNYADVKGDLCACFIVQCLALLERGGYAGLATSNVWMFLSSYEKLRRRIIEFHNIATLVQLSVHGFKGVAAQVCTFVLTRERNPGLLGGYVRLNDFDHHSLQEEKTLEALADPGCGWFYRRDAEAFEAIPGSPIAYWASEALIKNFDQGMSIDSLSDFTGSQHITADNEKYLRHWWEVSSSCIGSGKPWAPYSKGGVFRRWFGNLELLVRVDTKSISFYKSNPTSNCLKEEYWFSEGVTYSDITSGRQHFRYYPPIGLFDKKGPVICSLGETLPFILALLNSTVAQKYFDFLNPTMTLQVKDVKSLPVQYKGDTVTVQKLALRAIELSSADWSQFETSVVFMSHNSPQAESKKVQRPRSFLRNPLV